MNNESLLLFKALEYIMTMLINNNLFFYIDYMYIFTYTYTYSN